jgi:hypothetical protein
MLSVAPLVALARKGSARMAWAGLAVFGWSRFLVGALPHFRDQALGFGPIPSPGLLTESAYEYLLRYLVPARGLGYADAQIFGSLEVVLFGLVGAVVGHLLAAEDERPSS